MRISKYDKAIKFLESALNLEPNSINCLKSLGFAYFYKNENEKALEKALEGISQVCIGFLEHHFFYSNYVLMENTSRNIMKFLP